MKKLLDVIPTSTVSSMASIKTEISDLKGFIAGCAEKLQTAILQCREEAKRAHMDSLSKLRVWMNKRDQITKFYIVNKTPPVLIRWMADKGCFGMQSELLANPAEHAQAAGAARNPTAPPAPLITHVEDRKFTFNLKWDLADLDFDPTFPAAWHGPPATSGPAKKRPVNPKQGVEASIAGASWHKLEAAYGDRIAKVKEALIPVMLGDYQRQTGIGCSCVRMPPKGAPHDTVEKLEWIPQALLQMASPENLRSYGSPWLLGGLPGSCRRGTQHWAIPGFGKTLLALQGPVFLVLFCIRDMLDYGPSVSEIDAWLTGLSHKAFTGVADKHFSLVTLVQGDSVWVPYGYHAMMVTGSLQTEPSMVIEAPFLTATLATRFPQLGYVVQHNIDFYRAILQQKPWDKIGQPLLDWLQELAGGTLHRATGAAMIPIENGEQVRDTLVEGSGTANADLLVEHPSAPGASDANPDESQLLGDEKD